MKMLKLPKSSGYLLVCLFATSLLLAMTQLRAMAATFNVSVLVDSFSPSDITITVGDTVVWTAVSVSAGIHTVTGNPSGAGFGADGTCQETLNGLLATVGQTYSHTFTIPGVCHYVSETGYVATGMKGTVTVLALPTTTTSTTTTTTTTTTTASTTTTTIKEKCKKGKDKDKDKGKCKGHDKDK
jgi:plastocyanin